MESFYKIEIFLRTQIKINGDPFSLPLPRGSSVGNPIHVFTTKTFSFSWIKSKNPTERFAKWPEAQNYNFSKPQLVSFQKTEEWQVLLTKTGFVN